MTEQMGNGTTWADFRPPSSPAWVGCIPRPREAAGAPGSDSPGQGMPTSSNVPLSACRETISRRPEFHLDLISFRAGNLMDSLTLRDEAPAGPG